ncbi:N-acetylmuramoyl-L-alanine amidase [Clostridium nigeriense]|uniref:N-acetylmuramoyl-L-alanine amidase n=1 Tax=Clostridium nigeriense TaxID=1805470 RepID=UPI003D33F979
MKSVNELRRRNKRRRIYNNIKIFITIVILILISNKLISNYLNGSLPSNTAVAMAYEEESADSGKIKVILDPGHGGHDDGASFGDIYEKDIVLSISNKVGEILEANDIEVIYTRTDDSALGDDEKEDLKNRVSISNSTDAEYFVSFHINDYDEDIYGYEEVYGFEVWTNYNDYKSLNLGKSIEEKLEDLDYTECRPMIDGSEALYIIRENENPSVLIEFGFMNNYNDRMYFSNEYNQELLANAVATSIIENININ